MSQDSEKDIFIEAEEDMEPSNNDADIFADIEEDVPNPPAPQTVAPEPPASSPPSAYGNVDLHSESSSMVATTSIASRGGDDSDSERYRLQICVREPEKIGDGMSSYMVYKIHTRTDMPSFHKSEMIVSRRFSDFLGLREKLVARHQTRGIILPHPPEKNMVGMTKVKMAKGEESTSAAFVERRRAELQRFLEYLGRHPTIREDSDFQQFLEYEGDLPRAYSTQALSGAGVIRLFANIGQAVGKMTLKMEESDELSPENQEFEEIHIMLDSLERQLTRLLHNCDELVDRRRELSFTTAAFAQACSLLASAEENTALSRVLSQLAETEECVQVVHCAQSDTDFSSLCVLLKHYIGLISSIKESLYERVKSYKAHKDAEAMLTKKREMKVKLELAGKLDKVGPVETEIAECEMKVEKAKEDFDLLSKTLKKEISFFEKERVLDFKQAMVENLQDMLTHEEKIIEFWKTFEPEAESIPA